ncbi:Uncharacterised protein [Mycobacteroides abscessus subsp. abscessus]|nr:Uncharacterised protein [Mycobacteroides abscessus subsp. abscessus]
MTVPSAASMRSCPSLPSPTATPTSSRSPGSSARTRDPRVTLRSR